MVASLTPWCLAIPAAVLRPDSTSSTTAARCCPVSFGRRPGLRPASRATADPAAVRPLRLPRSSPARPPIIPAAAWPSGVVVSSASLRLRRPAPAVATCCMRCDHLGQGPAQARQRRHHDHVARLQGVEHPAQLGLLPPAPGGQVLDDPLAARLGQRPPVGGQHVPAVGPAPEVAGQHGATCAALDRTSLPSPRSAGPSRPAPGQGRDPPN